MGGWVYHRLFGACVLVTLSFNLIPVGFNLLASCALRTAEGERRVAFILQYVVFIKVDTRVVEPVFTSIALNGIHAYMCTAHRAE